MSPEKLLERLEAAYRQFDPQAEIDVSPLTRDGSMYWARIVPPVWEGVEPLRRTDQAMTYIASSDPSLYSAGRLVILALTPYERSQIK